VGKEGEGQCDCGDIFDRVKDRERRRREWERGRKGEKEKR
jgi:hypothetical protein